MKFELNIQYVYMLFGATVAAMILMNVTMSGHLEKGVKIEKEINQKAALKAIALAPAEEEAPTRPPKARYTHTPANPKDYGLIAMKPTDEPRSPKQWEMYYRSLFEKQKLLESPEAQEALLLARTKPEEYRESVKNLDEKMEEIRRAFGEDPLNEDLQKQLKIMYKLKAIGNIMNEKVLSESHDPFIEKITGKIPKKKSTGYTATP